MKIKYRFKLKARIHEAGFRSLTDLANYSGINLARLSRFVSGYELPNEITAQMLANALGVSQDELEQLFLGGCR